MNTLDTYWLGFLFGCLTVIAMCVGLALLVSKSVLGSKQPPACLYGSQHDFGPWLVVKEMDDRQSRHVVIQHRNCRHSKCRYTEARTQTTRF